MAWAATPRTTRLSGGSSRSRTGRRSPSLCSVLTRASREKLVETQRRSWTAGEELTGPARSPSSHLSRRSAKLSPLLHQGSGYLGVRVPMSGTCVELAGKVGGAITGTSANLSGQALLPHRRAGRCFARREDPARHRRRRASGEGVDRRQGRRRDCRGFKGGFGQDSGG